MAADKNDVMRTGDLFDSEDKQWLKVSVSNQVKALERAQGKYPAGSASFKAYGDDVGKLRKLLEKIG